MQVFKTTLRVFFKHISYVLIYLVLLSFMGVFIGISVVGTTSQEFVEERPSIAVIDRDNSEISIGLGKFLGNHANILELVDSRQAMQDAVAQNYVQYLIIIPNGFGKDFVAAESNGNKATELETVVSFESVAANMMNNLVDEYLNTMRIYISSNITVEQGELVRFANADMMENSTVAAINTSQSAPVSAQWQIYMKFVSYTTMAAIIICTAVMLSAFNRTDIRRRNLISPISLLSTNLQIALACTVVAILSWAWSVSLGLIVFGQTLAGVNTTVIGLNACGLLAIAIVSLAIGFLIGQLSHNEAAVNAAGNITGLVLSFFGGVWIPLELVGSEIAAIAKFDPIYYYNELINKASALNEFTSESITPLLGNIAMTLLFAVAIFSVALVIGRLKQRTYDAGGNAAAARPATN